MYKLPFLLAVVACAGCTDLSLVRDFAKTSSAVTANQPILAGWSGSYDDVIKIAREPLVDKASIEVVRDEAAKAKADAPLVKAAADALSAYFEVLGALANDGKVDVSGQVSGIAGQLEALKAIDKSTGTAVGALGKLLSIGLDEWRNVAVGDLIKNNDENIQIITEYLAKTSEAVKDADEGAQRATEQYWTMSVQIWPTMLLRKEAPAEK